MELVQTQMPSELFDVDGTHKDIPLSLTVLHCGDVFLDGPVPRLRLDTKERRREELREAFSAFMARVDEEKADAVLFSGNLVDGRYATNDTLTFLADAFASHPTCHFIIAPGPQDVYNEDSIYRTKRFPRNVHIFTDTLLGTYSFPELPLTVYGWGCAEDRAILPATLNMQRTPKTDRFTVLCGYSDLDGASEKASPMTKEAIATFGAHYAALTGGVHDGFHRAGDSIYAYSGSFEGRDDALAMQKSGGYVRLVASKSSDGWSVEAHRIPLDTYTYVTERLDVSHLTTVDEVKKRLSEKLVRMSYGGKTVLRLLLCGTVPLTADFDGLGTGADYGLYSMWVEDRTVPTDDDGRLFKRMDVCGELYRHFYPKMTEGTEESRVQAARAFRMGYAALAGEDFAKY